MRLPGPTALKLFGLNFGFVDQHHGNVIPDGINAPAFATLQTVASWRKRHGGFALRANEDVEKFLRNGHDLYADIRNLADAVAKYKLRLRSMNAVRRNEASQ